MRRTALVLVAALVFLLGLPSVAAAGGAVHLSSNGPVGAGSVRVSNAIANLPCLGVTAETGDIAEVWILNGWTNHLVVDSAGHAHIRVMIRDFTYAVYEAPDPDLPDPGDPGYLFLGTASRAIVFQLDQLTPNQQGDVTVRLSIPFSMHTEDGTTTVDAFYDLLVIIGLDGNGGPRFIAAAQTGGRCP